MDANLDSLMILDCCHSANAIRGQSKTINEVLAAATRESPSYSGARAYSKMLVKKLNTMKLPFTVADLHEEMKRECLPSLVENPDALIATPDHGWVGSSGARSIMLRELVPELKEIQNIDSNNPRIFMEIELDSLDQYESGPWQKWFGQTSLPSDMLGVRFYTKEDVYRELVSESNVLSSEEERAPAGYYGNAAEGF